MLKLTYNNVWGLDVTKLDPILLNIHLDIFSYNASSGSLVIAGDLPEDLEILILAETGEIPTTKETI